MEYFPRIQYVAAQPQSPRFAVKIERNTREIYRKDHLHADVQRHLLVNKIQQDRMRVKCSTFSLCARRFGAGQWSFLGSWFRKKWYSISEDSPQGERDKIAEKMMVTLAESGHPVFRAASPQPRGQLKSKRWKIVDPLLCRPGHDYNCFSHNYFCKSAQSLRSSRRNVCRI